STFSWRCTDLPETITEVWIDYRFGKPNRHVWCIFNEPVKHCGRINSQGTVVQGTGGKSLWAQFANGGMQSMKVLSKLAREGFSLDFFVCSNHHERRRPHYGLGKFLLLALNHAHRNIGQFPYSSRAIPKHQLLG